MRSLFVVFTAAILLLSACAHETRPDTRMQSFQVADVDRDARLTYGEYKAYLKLQADAGDMRAQKATQGQMPDNEKALLLKFQGQDMNRDTFLTADELSF